MNLARTATWLALGRGLVAFVALALPVVLARKLSQHDYGLYKQVDLAGALLLPVLLLGFDKSITYFVPRREREAFAEVSTPFLTLIGAAVVVVGFALVSPAAFGTLFGTAPILLLTAAAATYAIASTLQVIGARTLIAIDAPREAVVVPVLIGIPRTIVLVVVALAFPSLPAILWVILGAALASIGGWTVTLVRKGCLRAAFERAILVKHARYGGLLALGSVAQSWATQLDNFLVTTTLTPSAFAVYRIGRTRIPFLPIFSRALIDATAPRYSKLESERRHEEMAALWQRSFETLFPIGLLLSVFFSASAHWSVPIVYGEAYRESVPIFRVFAFGILLESLIGIEQLLRALAALRFLLLSVLVSLALRVGLGLVILHNCPLWVLTLSQIVISVALYFARLWYVRRRIDVPWSALSPLVPLLRHAPTAAIGLLVTLSIERYAPISPLLSLLLSGGFFGVLVLWTIWRQGLMHRMLPDRLARRLPGRGTHPR